MESLFPAHAEQFAAVSARLLGATKVAVAAHIKPDADAVGSACGLAFGLRQLGVATSVHIGQTYPHASNLDTVPGVGEIHYGASLPDDALVVTVDCASLDRTGLVQDAIAADPSRVVVIDHHETNPGFGGTNLIIDSESTTTLIRELFRHMGVTIDRDIAYCLYAGLVTDTGNFRWGTARMHALAAELMRFDLDTRQIALDLMDSMSAIDLKIMGAVLADMQTYREKGLTVAVIAIPAESLARMSQTAVEAVIDYARALQGSDVGVVFKQQAPRYWAVSLRSTVIDVSQVAKALGGGGHVPAAGYTAYGTQDAVTRELLGALPH